MGESTFLCANENTAPFPEVGKWTDTWIGCALKRSTLYVAHREIRHGICCGINVNGTIVVAVDGFGVSGWDRD